MAYKSAADGVASKGKTKADVMPTDGSKVIQGGKASKTGGLNAAMKKVGRNMARANNQK